MSRSLNSYVIAPPCAVCQCPVFPEQASDWHPAQGARHMSCLPFGDRADEFLVAGFGFICGVLLIWTLINR